MKSCFQLGLLACAVFSSVVSHAAVDSFMYLRIACRGCEMRQIPSASALSEVLVHGMSSNHLQMLEKENGIVLLVEEASSLSGWSAPAVTNLHAFSSMRLPLKGMVAARSLAAMQSLHDAAEGKGRSGLRRLRDLNLLGCKLLEDRLSIEFAYHCLARAGELAAQQQVLDTLPSIWLHPTLRNMISDMTNLPPIEVCWEAEEILQQNTIGELYTRIRDELETEKLEAEVMRILESNPQGATLIPLIRDEGLCTLERWERETREAFSRRAARDIEEISRTPAPGLKALGEEIRKRNGGNVKNLPVAGTLLEALTDLVGREELTEGQLREFHERAGEILTLGMNAAQLSDWCRSALRWHELMSLERIAVLECAARVYHLKEGKQPTGAEDLVESNLVPLSVAENPLGPKGELFLMRTDEEGRIRFFGRK